MSNPRSEFPFAAQWHFDECGYYAYVMVNGSQEVVDGAIQALSAHGIEITLYADLIRRTSATVAALSLQHDVVISRAFVSRERYEWEQTPFLLNVRREGVPV
jgi:hypothetical protein